MSIADNSTSHLRRLRSSIEKKNSRILFKRIKKMQLEYKSCFMSSLISYKHENQSDTY